MDTENFGGKMMANDRCELIASELIDQSFGYLEMQLVGDAVAW
jgi:hypothetical protein